MVASTKARRYVEVDDDVALDEHNELKDKKGERKNTKKSKKPKVKKNEAPSPSVETSESQKRERMGEEDYRASQKYHRHFKDAYLDEVYDLIPKKLKKSVFRRCYFANHRASGVLVLIVTIKQQDFDKYSEVFEDEEKLMCLVNSIDPCLKGIREIARCHGAVALVMDIDVSQMREGEIEGGFFFDEPFDSFASWLEYWVCSPGIREIQSHDLLERSGLDSATPAFSSSKSAKDMDPLELQGNNDVQVEESESNGRASMASPNLEMQVTVVVTQQEQPSAIGTQSPSPVNVIRKTPSASDSKIIVLDDIEPTDHSRIIKPDLSGESYSEPPCHSDPPTDEAGAIEATPSRGIFADDSRTIDVDSSIHSRLIDVDDCAPFTGPLSYLLAEMDGKTDVLEKPTEAGISTTKSSVSSSITGTHTSGKPFDTDDMSWLSRLLTFRSAEPSFDGVAESSLMKVSSHSSAKAQEGAKQSGGILANLADCSLPMKQVDQHRSVLKQTKFKNSCLDQKYKLMRSNARKAPFGKCYFALHRSSGDIVIIAKVKRDFIERLNCKYNDEHIANLVWAVEPRVDGLREKIEFKDSRAFIMDFKVKNIKFDDEASTQEKGFYVSSNQRGDNEGGGPSWLSHWFGSSPRPQRGAFEESYFRPDLYGFDGVVEEEAVL